MPSLAKHKAIIPLYKWQLMDTQVKYISISITVLDLFYSIVFACHRMPLA